MASRLNGRTIEDNLVFHFDTGDIYNSYLGRPTTNTVGDTMSNYNNVGGSVTTTLTLNGDYYRGAPVYKQVLTPLDSSGVSWLTAGNNPGLGVVSNGGGGLANRYTGHSIFFKPTVPMHSSPIYTHYSNIGGWQSSTNYEDMGDGWFKAHVLWYDTTTRSDGKYWAINPATASLNVPITIYWAGPFKEDLNVQSVSQYVYSSRSQTQGLKDLTNNITLDLTDVSFSNDVRPKILFDGSNDKIHNTWPSSLNVDDNTTPRTWEIVVKKTGGGSDTGLFGHKAGPGCSYYCNGGIYQANGRWYFNWYDNSAYRFMDSGINATLNEYFHIVGVFDTDANPRIYVNGVLRASYGSSTQLDYSSGMAYYDIGFNSDGGGLYYFTGEIPVAKFYKNKALTDVEVYQNFLHYQQRFNMTFTQNGIGGDSSSSYITSLDILKKTRTNTNGNYWFKPTSGTTPFQAYVEFETNGGNPWMHVGTIADENDPSNNSSYHVWSNNMNSAQACPPWDDESTFGGSTPTFVGDYKNLGWSTIPFKQIMIKDAGNSQRKILHTNEGQIKSSNSSLRVWFSSLKWDALGSDSSSSAFGGKRVMALDITNYGVNDPVLQSSSKSKMLFKYGEKDGAQDGNKDRTMIAWHRHDAGDGVDGPSGLGCFTNRGGTIDYRDIVPGSVYADGQDFPPSSIGGSYYYSIWIR